jgi:hypothetical protein
MEAERVSKKADEVSTKEGDDDERSLERPDKEMYGVAKKPDEVVSKAADEEMYRVVKQPDEVVSKAADEEMYRVAKKPDEVFSQVADEEETIEERRAADRAWAIDALKVWAIFKKKRKKGDDPDEYANAVDSWIAKHSKKKPVDVKEVKEKKKGIGKGGDLVARKDKFTARKKTKEDQPVKMPLIIGSIRNFKKRHGKKEEEDFNEFEDQKMESKKKGT